MRLSKLLIFLLLVTSSTAKAALITWTIDDITISQSQGPDPFIIAVVSGSFDYDATADIYSNINVTSIATYNTFSNGDATYLDSTSTYLDFISVLNFNFDTPLTDAGGIINASVDETLIRGLDVNLLTGSGTITGIAAVPVPAAVWLFSSGLFGLIGVARRRSS